MLRVTITSFLLAACLCSGTLILLHASTAPPRSSAPPAAGATPLPGDWRAPLAPTAAAGSGSLTDFPVEGRDPKVDSRERRREEDARSTDGAASTQTPDGGERRATPEEVDTVVISGLVETPKGEAAAGCDVHFISEGSTEPQQLFASTNEDGLYRVVLPDDGRTWAVTAVHEEHGSVTRRVTAVDGVLDLRLRRGFRMRGRVLESESHAPVAAATVIIIDAAGNEPSRQLAITDDAGEFELAGLSAGAYRVTIRGDGIARLNEPLNIRRAPGSQRDFFVEAEQRVSGTVSDRKGRPVAGALIELVDAEGGRRTADTSDATGRFEIRELGTGIVTIEVTRKNFARWRAREAWGESESDLAVTLSPGIEFSGQVISEDNGDPVPFALVNCVSADPLEESFFVRSDARGFFAIVGLSEGNWDVTISAPEFATRVWSKALDESQSDFEFALLRGQDFQGQILDPAGETLEGVAIQIFSEGPNPEVHGARSDADGRFTVHGLTQQSYRAIFVHAKFERLDVQIDTGQGLGEFSFAGAAGGPK